MPRFPWFRPIWAVWAVALWTAVVLADWIITAPRAGAWNVYLTIIWAGGLPAVALATGGGLAFGRWARRPYALTLGPRPATLIFQIPTVGRWDVWPGLCRVLDSCVAAQTGARVPTEVWVVTEDGAPIVADLRRKYPTVEVLVVPRLYTTARGSRFKARANQYANEIRHQQNLTHDQVWVYHLDDDTSIPPEAQRILEAWITQGRQRYTLAQGVLTYPADYAAWRPAWLADAVRPGDDLTRFFFFTGWWHRPWVGLHGENLLVRADREWAIGWDWGPSVLVEDAYFGLTFAARFPGEAGFLPLVTTGASPTSLAAFRIQRARWVDGMFRLLVDRTLPIRWKAVIGGYVTLWASTLGQNVLPLLLLAYGFGWDNTSPLWHWVAILWGLNYGFWVVNYLIGYHLNLAVSHQRPGWARRLADYAWLILGLPLLNLLEVAGLLAGLWRSMHPQAQFAVIAKSL